MKSSFVINSSNPPDMLIDLLLNNKLIDGLPEHASSATLVGSRLNISSQNFLCLCQHYSSVNLNSFYIL